MSIYRRGGVYWYEFTFQCERIQKTFAIRPRTASIGREAEKEGQEAPPFSNPRINRFDLRR
jgi:hypothetical protein